MDRCIRTLANTKDEYVKRPGKDFSRTRLFTFEKLIEFLIVKGVGSQTKEISEFFKFDLKTPTASSLIQQRDKLKSEALLHLLQNFTETFKKIKIFKGYRLLAVDGSKVTISTNPNDYETYMKGVKGLVEMIKRSPLNKKVILTADRGYESYTLQRCSRFLELFHLFQAMAFTTPCFTS